MVRPAVVKFVMNCLGGNFTVTVVRMTRQQVVAWKQMNGYAK